MYRNEPAHVQTDGVNGRGPAKAPEAAVKPVASKAQLRGGMHRVGNFLYPFQTPILVRNWPEGKDANVRLRELILARRAKNPGIVKSNAGGGWHSDPDFFKWNSPDILALSKRVGEAVYEMTATMCGDEVAKASRSIQITGWANVLGDRGYNRVHNHPEAAWSGVYYVDLGTPDPTASEDSGSLEFIDPRGGATSAGLPAKIFGVQVRVTPQPGLLVLFPSWLHHWVHPVRGGGERISIAFNIQFAKPQKPAAKPVHKPKHRRVAK